MSIRFVARALRRWPTAVLQNRKAALLNFLFDTGLFHNVGGTG